MAKKKSSKKKESKESNEDIEKLEGQISQLPPEARDKLKNIKEKLDKFQGKAVAKFDKYIVGIGLMPPTQQLPAAFREELIEDDDKDKKKDDEKVNIIVLIDDSDSQKMSKDELKEKLSKIMQNMAEECDKSLRTFTILHTELWQNCYDCKYDLLQIIALSAPVYDTGMLSAVKIAEIHKSMILKKFEKYIVSYVLAGSLVQGKATKTSDIDVWVVIDDTDVKKMTRVELKDKLRAIIIQMGMEAGEITGIRNKLNIQVYILTDFWDSLKEANPVIFTLLRDGVPFYDRGIFMPWKQLLKMGKIKPSPEAIEMFMSSGDQILQRARFKIKDIGMEDTFYAILTPSQAALMMYGIPPPTPKETPVLMKQIFVDKEKMLEPEYIKILEKNINTRKDLEHGSKKELSGKDADELLKNAEKFLERIKKLFIQIETKKEEDSIVQIYDTIVTMIRDVLKSEGIEKANEIEILKLFDDELISTGKIPAKYLRTLNMIIKAKKDYEAKKLTKSEVEQVKKQSRDFIRFIVEYIQRKRGIELEKTKIKVKYGKKYGEVILLGEKAFIIHDIDKEDKGISTAVITKEGGLDTITESNLEELEKAIVDIKIPPKAFIKQKIFEDLKRIFGKDVEILVQY